MKKILKSLRGITLPELLIALILTALLSAAMFKIYINQHHAWMIQDRVIEMQQNARAAIDELTRQLRQAGYELPNGLRPIEAYDTNPDTVVIYYKSTIDCDAKIDKTMPQPSAELDCTDPSSDVSCFSEGQYVYIHDPFIEQGEFFTISHVQVTPGKIQHNTDPLSRCYPSGSIILGLDKVKFYVDQSDVDHPKLMIQMGDNIPQIYAEDIVDLQFEYTLKNGMTMSVPSIPKDVRDISINLTARTPDPDVEFANDPYRYERYQSRVYLRNLGY
jgi:type II secretory pathway pseudopilin PulG